jgi:transketolase N-terminal domain/subunit
MSVHPSPRSDMAPGLPYDRRRLEDIGYMTCMTLTLLGNYAQTGHFGGPLAYTPFNVAAHLAGPELGGLRYDYRRPKHPYGDKFMLAAGHCAPTCYALWMILGQALYRKHHATGDPRYHVTPDVAMLPVDALGFRRGAGALRTLLADQGLSDHPLFAQAKGRGIRALSGHIESTDLTNDVNGGPSGVGVATAAGKAAFWDIIGAPMGTPKVIALEGEFAMTEGHAQELKTQAIALQVGKRLRIFLSDNNAGIDDSLIGGVVASKFSGYRLVDQWTSYGWNVLTLPDGHDYDQIVGALRTMEAWDPADRRPMIVIGTTTKGYWPGAVNGKIPGAGDQVVGYPSHPYGMKMNSEYFVALARTFEARYGVEFQGISQGPVTDPRERLIQFKTNIDVVMSVLERDGLGDWLADRLVEIGDSVPAEIPLRVDVKHDPFLDDRLKVANLPEEPQTLTAVPQGGRAGGRPTSRVRDRQMGEPRHRQPRADLGGRPLGIDQPRARQHLGPLRPRNQPAGDAAQGRDRGSGQRIERHRPGRPERVAGPRPVCRGVGVQRHLRRLHAADVPARARVEPAEPGQ